MGRRGGGGSSGGGQGRSNFDRILRRHIESATKGQFATVEQLVDHLRSTYPHYARHKIQPFTKRVDRIIQTSNPIHVTVDDSGDDSPSLKKRRKVDEREEKLQHIEAQHMRKKNADVLNSSGGCSSSSLASPSSSADENTSTSEDAIYEEKFEPEFDLMKSMLRENLRRKSKGLVKSGSAKEVVELDVVNSNDLKKVNLMDIEGQSNDGLRKISNNDNGGGVGDKIKGPLFKDLGGMAGVLDELLIKVIVPLYHPQVPRHLGVRPVGGILLHGPPGCGKTTLARAIANETRVPFYEISAAALVSGVSGASEENIRELFSKAYRTAPSIVFIDEIDAIASKRENLQREMERRIVTQLMTCMDASQPVEDNAASEGSDVTSGCVLVIGATNRPDALDPALRRPGRFDREIYLGVPDEVARIEILTAVTRNLKVEGSFDLVKIARSTPGWVGADLTELTNEAGKLAIKRIIGMRKTELSKELMDSNEWWRQPWPHEDLEKLFITMADFEEAAKMVQSSTRREGFSAIPNVKWDDVGGFNELKQEFDRYIVRRIKFSKYYEHFGVDLETGFLLYGPPGCGKTLIAKAVANEAGANFIHIKGPELLNKYVGESELAIRTIFSRARTCSPCILFFDEVDALTTKRGKEGGWVVERLLNQLLIELDGSEERRGVYVIGATNRPQSMDPAVLRPGRFGKLMYVPLPNEEERGMILKALARDKPLDTNVDLMILAKDISCQKLSGADLAFVMKEASAAALEEVLASSDGNPEGVQWTIQEEHLKRAIEKTSPSVEDKQIRYFNRLSKRFKAS